MRKALATILVAVTLSGVGCGKPRAPAIELPAADQIAEMRVRVPAIEGFSAGPIPEFVVPPEHVPKILFWLRPAEPDRFSVSVGVEHGIYFHVADITVRTKDGRELCFRCHDWGNNPVTFTPNGKDYYQGRIEGEQGEARVDGGVKLYLAIAKAHKARTE